MGIPAEWLWCAALAGALLVGYAAGTFWGGLLALGHTAQQRDRALLELAHAKQLLTAEMMRTALMKEAVDRWVAFSYRPAGAMGPTRTVYGSPEDVEWLKVRLAPAGYDETEAHDGGRLG
jgi:hypothetical protein